MTVDLFCRSVLALGLAVVVAEPMRALVDFDTPLGRARPSARVTSTEFGTWTTGGLAPFDVLPLTAGTSFGWRLEIPDGESVAWREELVLPHAPATWSGADLVEVRDDGRTAVAAGIDSPCDGVLEHGWTITPGDPAGAYELRLFVDGRLHRVFAFEVQAQPDGTAVMPDT